MTGLTIRGLPSSIKNDGWWLVSTPTSDYATARQGAELSDKIRKAPRIGIPILLALIGLADFLFWGHSIGLSMIIFSAGLTGLL